MTKLIILLTLLTSFTSCRLNLPVIGDAGTDDTVGLRNVSISCIEDTQCQTSSIVENEIFVFYSKDRCIDFNRETSVLAMARSSVSCSLSGCTKYFEDYTTAKETVSVFWLDKGFYTVMSFVDLNANESLDDDEPYFCNEEVELASKKVNVDLDISIEYLKNEQ